MEAVCVNQEIGDLNKAAYCRIPGNPYPLHCHDGAHGAESRFPGRTGIRSERRLAEVGHIPCSCAGTGRLITDTMLNAIRIFVNILLIYNAL